MRKTNMRALPSITQALPANLPSAGTGRLLQAGLIALILMLLQACAGYSVKTDKDDGFALADYSTFRFAEPVTAVTKSADLVNPLVVNRIQEAIAKELKAMGLEQTPGAEASEGLLIVDFTLQSEERVRYRPSTLSLGFGVRRGGLLMGGARDVLPEDYTSGRFAVELRKPRPAALDGDAEARSDKVASEVVWFGVANHNFLGMSANDSQQQVDEVVRALLEEVRPSAED
ncbi:MAG: hypothetical protein CME36_17010 [unclassified Hahellaceae]|nr:hypothetical protein [Hahellaceae bacterium]|tara:strand:+ start:29476 stop:30165 length:690 start_codon:yes stop_codon:yes gene_type:complete